jgi:hypothetical protein
MIASITLDAGCHYAELHKLAQYIKPGVLPEKDVSTVDLLASTRTQQYDVTLSTKTFSITIVSITAIDAKCHYAECLHIS